MPREYKQKVRDAWLKSDEFKTWARRDDTDERRVLCSYCKCTITAKLSDLRAHALTKKHKSATGGFEQSNKLDFVTLPIKTMEQEAALCLFIAEHTSFAQIDHLGNICIKYFEGDSASRIRLHRTKCTNIIKNVLGLHFSEELRGDIGDSKFSLQIDESTDISFTKLLGVAINYYSSQHEKFVSTFLNLISLEQGNASSIVEALKKELKDRKLDIKNLIGIGTDNANVMVGTNKSVYTELKKEAPSLILIKCVCHSIQLAVSPACKDFLPASLEFLVHETYNWFSKSSARQIEYRKIYQSINDDKAPLKIPKVSDTRWLSIELAVSRILQQWEELKLHFCLAANKERCHKAELWHQMFNDENYLYLLFLNPILSELQKVNKCFQSKNTNSTELLNDLTLAIESLKKGIIPPDIDVDLFATDDFEKYVHGDLKQGYEFEKHLNLIKLDPASEKEIRECCSKFLLALIKQLKQRIPDNYKVLRQVDILSVNNVLRHNKTDIIPLLEGLKCQNIGQIESQYKKIHLVKWINIESTVKFWIEVNSYKDSGGNNSFAELAKFAIDILSLPWSNAEVERIFSQVNLVKSKLRNKLELTTLNSVLYIRYGLRRLEKCCYTYTIPEKFLRMIGTGLSYQNQEAANIDEIMGML